MFQRPALLPWRSVLSNVMLPVEISDGDSARGKAAYQDRAHELLELVGLQGFERRLPHELSGGMQQRVSLCRSLIRDPQVMLMDEPFSALDALTRTELSEELQRIQMELATTIVFVTHSIEEAVVLADRVVVLTPAARAAARDRRDRHPAAAQPGSARPPDRGGPDQRAPARPARGAARHRSRRLVDEVRPR